ncbi:hypothetical protein [Leptothoe spongobia]|uniref:Uncharacterized protein n=1 Tax=Leptothoe spongobia TAU-MAC 1115 TaxID=1967444 RepID=A0A947DCV7_9CYAN|nr:hypothetical protein [Leptothoe spongobia]MBT9314388.1 hypothetical protein [Leptothoe spongobia TAU-MAC 1115]
MNVVLNNLGLALTVASALAGVCGWGIARIRRNYGFERDINHLKNDYKGLNDSCNKLFTELERRLDAAEKELAILRAVNEALIQQQRPTDVR